MNRDPSREGKTDAQDLGSTQVSGRPHPTGTGAAVEGGATPPPLSDLVTNGGAVTQWSVGQLLSDRFEIRSVAGMGGMGVVYRAFDQELGRDVALKVLREGAEQERFSREARLLSQLDHENIVKYLAEGAAASGQRFLAMEWLEGHDLSTHLGQGRLSIRDAVGIARRVASALAVAHDLGVVHRDINPRNIFLVERDPGRVKVLDFGVARAPTVTRPLTSAGSPIGTPGYMAPEQAQGLANVTAAADVFGLGCVLYECLTGRRAFSGQTLMELFARILVDDVRPVRALVSAAPPALDALVAKMLSKSPASRFQHGREIVDALSGIGPLSDVPVSEAVPPQSEGAITDAEQRLSSIILLTRISDAQFANVGEATRQHGVQPQRLADGSVVVVVGHRGSATDQVAAAARCALDVRPSVTGAVIAVATGRAVTNGDKPMGEAIERASAALLEVAKSEFATETSASESRIFVDRVTAGLLDARFDVATTPAGLLLVGMRDEGEPIRTVLGRRTRCVGRRRELAFFDSTLEECIDDSVARAVLVTGASGIGKTRLVHEFLRSVRRGTPEVAVLLARGEPTSVGSPFAVLGRAISAYAGMHQASSLSERQTALYNCLARVVPPLELARTHQFLCELTGAALSESDDPLLARARGDHVLMGDQMRRAFEDWLSAECRARPVLLVFDDFHWGDLPTVHFIDAVLRNLSEQPLMVLGLAQPEVHQTFPELWSRRGVFQLRLTGLSRRASERLAREILGENADPLVVQRVVERAQGNPFWLEELVRVEAESGQVPEAVVLMAQARLERLNNEARLVLRAASILGRRFWDGGVLALLGPKLSSVALARVLGNLEEREVVTAGQRSKFLGQREFEFTSSLLRDAAYGSLTPGDLERGHLAAGHWLEGVGEQDAVALADHFSMGRAQERATHWYTQGAEQALRGNDWMAARERAREGRTRAANVEQKARLLAVEAEACRWSGDNGRALECSLEILGSLPAGEPTWCRAAGEAIAAAGKLSDAAVYREWGARLLGIEPAATNDAANELALITALGRSATQLVLCGEVELGRLLLNRADEIARSVSPGPEVLAWVLEARAVTAGAMDNASERVELAAAAAESFEAAGDLRNACLQQISVGYACVEIGAYARAERALTDGLEVAQRMGLSNSIPIAQAQLGRALETFGRFDQARGLLHEAIEALDKHANTRLAGVVRCYLAQALLRQGSVAEAERVGREAVDVLEGVPPMRPTALATLALVRLAQEEPEAALELARRANEGLGPETRLNFGEALVRLSHGLALTATGHHGEAKVALEAARERLLRRAGLISDPELKELFLTAVLENRTTLELASEVSR